MRCDLLCCVGTCCTRRCMVYGNVTLLIQLIMLVAIFVFLTTTLRRHGADIVIVGRLCGPRRQPCKMQVSSCRSKEVTRPTYIP